MVQRYEIVVAYEGTMFYGWQVQKDKISVAHVLQATFAKVFGRTITLLGASRTDAGVHALGQVATFTTDVPATSQRMLLAWNNALPPTIVIKDLQLVADDFNPHRNILYKEYWYHVFTRRPLPFFQRYGWFYRYPIDYEKLNDCLQLFVGTHDFRSFYTDDGSDKNTVRTVMNTGVTYHEQYDAHRITIKGPGFLRYMIRRMVGAALDVASRTTVSVSHLQNIFEQCDPRHTLPNAPAQGLLLHKIVYADKKTKDEQ